MELVPPSAFEAVNPPPAAPKSSQELLIAIREIKALKQENEQLKLKASSPVFKPQKSFNEQVQPHQLESPDNRKYVDELISRQVSEINELKLKLLKEEANYQQEINDLTKQLSSQKNQSQIEIDKLEELLVETEDRLERKSEPLKKEQEQKNIELKIKIEEVLQDLAMTKANHSYEVEELQNEKKQLSDSLNELQEKLRSKDLEIDNQSKQISQLKNYIGQTESTHKPQELWNKENETLQNKLKICEAEKENVSTNLQLMSVRLASMNEILTLQETELSKAQAETLDKSKLEAVLLTRWREKVFQLLVQQKSEEIAEKKNHQNWKEKTNDLNEKLLSCENQIKVLHHSLSDKGAQLDMEVNDCHLLKQELHAAQSIALSLDDRLLENRENMESLKTVAESFYSKFLELFQSFYTIGKTLNVFGQRVSFASSRINMIKSQFSRKQALLDLQSRKGETDIQQTDEQSVQISVESHLSEELRMVTVERDNLAAQVRNDSQMWNETLNSVKMQYEEEISNLKKTIEGLELSLQDKSQNCSRQSEKIENLQDEITELNETVEQMKVEIARHEINTSKALDEQRMVQQNEFSEEFAAMERKVNESQREHAKAVVSLRQMERQMGREKQRFKEQMDTAEHHYNRQVTHLESQLKALEKERNIMMATLRQEGLISKIKSERPEPLSLDLEQLDHDNSTQSVYRDLDMSTTDKERLDKSAEEEEPLTAVLEDIESLSAAMLEPDSPTDH